MKRHLPFAGILTVILISALLALGGNQTFLGSLVTVDNTTSNSTALAAGTFSVPVGRFAIQNGGLTATNALRVNVQISVDNTNFLTVATYWPAATNATTETYIPSIAAQTIYLRVQAVTTNAVQVGTSYSY